MNGSRAAHKRRGRGDGGLHWDKGRQRWIATVAVGYDGRGKRITRKASGKTRTEARDKLKEMIRDLDDGLAIAPHGYTVADAVRDWLAFGLNSRDTATVTKLTILANTHVIPAIGARKLRELSADDVDRWLASESKRVSTRTLQDVRSILRRAVSRAQARNTRDFRCWCPLGVLRSLGVISSLLSGLAGGIPALAHDDGPRDAAGGRAVPRAAAPAMRGVPPSLRVSGLVSG